jgi:hypothetical protein
VTTNAQRRANWWWLALPASYLAHLCEEWWGGEGFAAWTARVVGAPISETRFILLNSIAAPMFILGTVLAITRPAWAWFIVSLGTAVLINGLLHALGAAGTRSYSPGVVTGAALFVPLGILALRRGRRRLSEATFWAAAAGGVAIHTTAIVVAFWR